MTHRTERGHLRSLINTVSWATLMIESQLALPYPELRLSRIREICKELERQKKIAQDFAFTKPKKKGTG